MKTKNKVLSSALATVLVCGGIAVAQAPPPPSENINPRYENLAAAQHHIVQAYQKISEAEHEAKYDLGGHAEKAQQLLTDADRELKAAAEYAEHKK